MDATVPDDPMQVKAVQYEDFLLEEGLEVLANYRAIGNDAIRLSIRKMLAAFAGPTDVDLN